LLAPVTATVTVVAVAVALVIIKGPGGLGGVDHHQGQAAQTVRFGTLSPGNNRPTLTVLPAPPLSKAIDLPEIAW
jgi:hypothetical protein